MRAGVHKTRYTLLAKLDTNLKLPIYFNHGFIARGDRLLYDNLWAHSILWRMVAMPLKIMGVTALRVQHSESGFCSWNSDQVNIRTANADGSSY
jgi:hypothetical protein